ncbi:MAG: NAD(P)(+) transhydrogenase (Re/Si-specific) subunit beta [Gammaproteobacteria bacterium]|nr:NAD(P)(+) transhydrogenase (Re/Si-specific) subunit beta [Gammaproteobacteria bacterium]
MHNYSLIIQIAYYAAAVLFIFGLKRMGSPKTAANGIYWAGLGVLVAIIATFLFPGIHNIALILVAIAISSIIAWWSGRVVALTAMPEMIAMFNGMGGGAAAAIAAVELLRLVGHPTLQMPISVEALGLGGALIGAISFTGSIFAFLKLRDWLDNIWFPMQQIVNLLFLFGSIALGIAFVITHSWVLFTLFFIASAIFGILMTIPIGGADMPVVISLYNAFTGLAVACEGFLLNNIALIIAGTIVGSAGTLLTLLMAKAMNRSVSNILFSKFGAAKGGTKVEGEMKALDIDDAAINLNYVSSVVFVPGYGMAVAQAQQKVWELAQLLISRGVDVKFAIHPVAGRMPGHMNVLLAEAGVPYDYIYDMDDINPDFDSTDVAIILGANDVVNPSARTDKNSPIYGMPIINADHARQIYCIKRGKGLGYSGVVNTLFFDEKTKMVYGDAKSVMNRMIQVLKENE